MSNSVPSEASKKDVALIHPATDRAQGGDARAFLTETALLRLEAGLRAQREQPAETLAPLMQRAEQETPSQEGRLFSEPDAASSRLGAQPLGEAEMRTADWLIVSSQIETISESPALAPRADQPKIRAEEPVPSPSWRRRKVGLLLCALFLVVGAGALGVSLKTRTAGSTDAASVNTEAHGQTASAAADASVAPDSHEPPQPITNAVKLSAALPSLPPLSPAPPNEQPVEPPAASEAVAVAPPNEQPVEAQGSATAAEASSGLAQ
jgi:hypothetical protein